MRKSIAALFLALLLALLSGGACSESSPDFDDELTQVHTDLNYLKDEQGRYVYVHGVNVSGNAKLPFDVDPESGIPTYVGRPFPREEFDQRFGQLKDFGFNVIRLLFLWESVFPEKRDKVDDVYLDYFEELISKANEYGIYVLINMHENLWGRGLYAMYNENAPGSRGDLDNMIYSMLPDLAKLKAGRNQCWSSCNTILESAGEDDAAESCQIIEKSCDARGTTCAEATDVCALVADACVEEGETCDNANAACTAAREDCEAAGKECDSNIIDCRSACTESAGELPEICHTYYREAYNNRISGDGAPLWATKACLPEKNFDSPYWGMFKLWGTMVEDNELPDGSDFYFKLDLILNYLQGQEEPLLDPKTVDDVRIFMQDFKKYLPVEGFSMTDTCDVLPMNNWWNNMISSMDIERCYASFYAGDELYPDKLVDADGVLKDRSEIADVSKAMDLKEYLQGSFKQAWVEIAKRAAKYPNVIGYDIINEPSATFYLYTVMAAFFEIGASDLIRDALVNLIGPEEMLGDETIGDKLFYILAELDLIPKDNSPEERKRWGFEGMDLFAAIGLNDAFDVFRLQPLFEMVGQAIQEVDPEAVIWIEPTGSGSLMGDVYMTKPVGVDQVVYTPHYYPDIYPWVGMNMPERDFSVDEIRYRDYSADLAASAGKSTNSLSNIPVVFGEFGTYWNYKYKGEDWDEYGIWQSIRNEYRVSIEILDNYYESYEKLFMGNILWNYCTTNTYENGDGWNKEDFSIIDPDGNPRGELTWSRPHPNVLSGKPVSMHFYSDYHYFDPQAGVPNAEREFELIFETKETDAPTVIFVPQFQYPKGFYVWLSDGWAAWDNASHLLYFYPKVNTPRWQHKVVIRPPYDGQELDGWSYFVKGDYVINGGM